MPPGGEEEKCQASPQGGSKLVSSSRAPSSWEGRTLGSAGHGNEVHGVSGVAPGQVCRSSSLLWAWPPGCCPRALMAGMGSPTPTPAPPPPPFPLPLPPPPTLCPVGPAMRSEPSVQCTADQAEDPLLGESAPGQDVSSGRALRGVGLRGPGCPQTASVPFQGPRSIRFGKKAEEGAGCLQIPNHPSPEVALLGPCPSGPGVPLRTWDETPPASPALCLPPRPRVWAPGTEPQGALLRPTDHIWSQSPGPGPGHLSAPGIPGFHPRGSPAPSHQAPRPAPGSSAALQPASQDPPLSPRWAPAAAAPALRSAFHLPGARGPGGCCWSCFLLPLQDPQRGWGKARTGWSRAEACPGHRAHPGHATGLSSGRAGPAAPLSQLGNRSP